MTQKRMAEGDECLWDDDVTSAYLKGASSTSPPPRMSLKDFVDSSNNFFVRFPIETARVKTLVKAGRDPGEAERNINSAYPVLHERCLPLYAAFLRHKQTHGTAKEKSVYGGMDVVGLADRLLRKRPVTFFARGDQYLLRDGSRGAGGFELIGGAEETPPLCLQDYLSYDEMKLSALLSVSSRSFFVNDGSRHNKGVPGAPGTFQESGVIVGMVGARMKKKGYMEWQDCLVTPEQNAGKNGYGSRASPTLQQAVWARMWAQTLPEWRDVREQDERFLAVSKKMFLNVDVYKERMRLAAEVLLAEAKVRAAAEGLKAYVHVVGLGLGVWRASKDQDAMFVDAWGEALRAATSTSHVAHVDFSWIGADSCLGVRDGEQFPGTEVTIHFSRRSLHDPVPAGTTLVVSYAWDGNSLPGNEYWIGKLSSTGDGAAACSSEVAELHNAHINKNVCGANLHVAGPWGVVHVAEYARRRLGHSAKKTKR
ncbi:uncharacterized protein LOC122260536 isoform X3 [Penaeus japonicus]|uniref:uncharacterized protein LOC122260536 isoform X3 n=1 Tax=Penaeus japonicus TaxID=27405 RepID=UPI001C70EAE9|nr:uncharacterized protein LOC122260536 isoform X3 [Penaeus japonicus]